MLTREEIHIGYLNGDIVIDPFDEANFTPNGYDVRLGNWFYEVEWMGDEPYFIGPISVPDGEKIYIPTGGTILGMTKEKIGTIDRHVPQIHSRSTTRRMGIDVCASAGLGDIGYHNHWTVELSHFVTRGRPYLVVGERFAQIVFHTTAKVNMSYEGQYGEMHFPECMVPKAWRKNIISP